MRNFRRVSPLLLTALYLFLLSSATTMVAQVDFRQRQLTMDDGLPSNAVYALAQDQMGFIWLGTENGLCRHDGMTLAAYQLPEGSSQRVTALLPLGTDSLFVGTASGVYCLSLATEQFRQLPFDTDMAVTSLTSDADGSLWLSTRGQGVACMNGDGEIQLYSLPDCDNQVSQVFADHANRVWALSGDGSVGLWHLNKTKNQFEAAHVVNRDAMPADLTCMAQTADEQRWIGTREHGLWLLGDDGVMTVMPQSVMGHSMGIHAMIPLEAHKLLVCCDDGLWLFDTQQHTFTLYLPQRYVYAALPDREHGLWVGTYYGGLTYVSPIAHRFDATPGGMITRFAEDRRGRIWVAGNEGGVSCYQRGRRQEPLPVQQQLQHLNVHGLCADGDLLWIGTYADGVYQLNTVSGALRHFTAADDGLTDDNSYAIFRSQKGTVWVATMGGLCRYDAARNVFLYEVGLPAVTIDIDEDQKGRLWLSTQGSGLYRYDGNKQLKAYRYDSKNELTLADDVVNCSYIDKQGTLWVGTQRGLCRYDAEKDCFSRMRLDVPKQAVASVTGDQDVLWLSGDCGILKYAPKGGVLRFTRQDGLVSEQFLPNSVLKASDGCLYFGTVRGFNSFYPNQIKVNEQQPPVFITQLELGNERVEVGSWHLPRSLTATNHLHLYYADRVFSLTFASLSYCSPEKNMYAYMLEGFDKQWNYVGNDRKATYTNLPAGEYTFRVRATNNDGVWAAKEAVLVIEVHPPFWWNIYAKVFYVVLFIALLWAYIWLRLHRAERRHRKEIKQLNDDKERELREARMEFFTTIAHEIRTPVSLIIGPLEKMKEEIASLTENSELRTERYDYTQSEKANSLTENGELRTERYDYTQSEKANSLTENSELKTERYDYTQSEKASAKSNHTSQFSPLSSQLEPLRSQLDIVDRNAHRLLDLVNQLLDFRKAEQQQLTDFSAQNIGSLLQRVVLQFRPAFEQAGRHFDVSLPKERLTAVVDAEGIIKLVSNMLSNANKYAHHRITLNCRMADDGQHFLIEVGDDGPGISEQDQQRVFLPFFQAKEAKPGTGIGLSIVKHITEAHHGRVDIQSALGQGTTFRVILPLKQENVSELKTADSTTSAATEAVDAPAIPVAPLAPEKPHLLIVDDNEDMLTFLVTTFMDNYEVTSARDGEEALAIIKESLVVKEGSDKPVSTFDIVISDWAMDRMEGPELCGRLRQHPATVDLPFILLTAKTDSQSKVLAMERGVDAFIEKPFNVKYVEACIRNLLKKKQK